MAKEGARRKSGTPFSGSCAASSAGSRRSSPPDRLWSWSLPSTLRLAGHHFVDPDRGKRRRAALRARVVSVDPQPLADVEGALPVLGGSDADGGQAEVHRPLSGFGRAAHFLLDPVQQDREIEAVGLFVHPFSGQAP